jgi:hypothetical protein
VFELHQTHAFNAERFSSKTWGMFLHAAPFLYVLAALALVAQVRKFVADGDERSLTRRLLAARGLLHWGVMALAGLLVSALGYSTQWAEPNAFLPGILFGAAFLAVALPVGGRGELFGLALVCAQCLFSLLLEPTYQPIQDEGFGAFPRSYVLQDPWRTIPSEASRRRALEFRRELEKVDGEVLALHRPYWSVLAGGSGHVGAMGLNDVIPEDRERVEARLRERVRAQEFAVVFTEGEPPDWLLRELGRSYVVGRRLHGKDRIRPLVGWTSDAGMVTDYEVDQLWIVPASDRTLPSGAVVIGDFEDGVSAFELEGSAFAPASSLTKKRRSVGPIGGRRFLSSLRGGVAAKGIARSPAFRLPESGHVEALVGTTGRRRGLEVLIVDVADRSHVSAWPLPLDADAMTLVEWTVPADFAGREVQLELVDETKKAALHVDDVRVVTVE